MFHRLNGFNGFVLFTLCVHGKMTLNTNVTVLQCVVLGVLGPERGAQG